MRPFIQNFRIETRDAAGCKPRNSALKQEGQNYIVLLAGLWSRRKTTGRRRSLASSVSSRFTDSLLSPAEWCRQKWGGRSLVSLAGLSPQVSESKGRKRFPAWCSAWDCRISFERRGNCISSFAFQGKAFWYSSTWGADTSQAVHHLRGKEWLRQHGGKNRRFQLFYCVVAHLKWPEKWEVA